MKGEGALEIGGDFVGTLRRQILGDDNEAFDWHAAVPRIFRRDRNPMRCYGKSRVRIAVPEAAITDDLRRGGAARIDDCRQRPVGDIDGFERILSAVAIAGNNHYDRLSHVANPTGCDTPMLDWQLDGCVEWPGPAPGILTGDDTLYTRHRHRTGGVDRRNLGMSMLRRVMGDAFVDHFSRAVSCGN